MAARIGFGKIFGKMFLTCAAFQGKSVLLTNVSNTFTLHSL